jgi:hypothetical protein
MKSTRAFKKRMRLYEAVESAVAAIINISPNSVIDLMEGDELSVDMITDADDEPLEQLVSLADSVIVDEVLGDNSYKIAVNVSDELGASGLYQWICNYTNIKSLEEIEEKVAPGLSALLGDDDIDEAPTSEDDGIIPFPEDEDDDLPAEGDFDGEMDKIVGESVSSKFAKYRKLYEAASEVLNEKGEEEEDDFSDIFGDDAEEPAEGGDEDAKGEESEEADAEDKDADAEDTEDVPMTAVLLTVNKDDADKCKDEMIDAGIAEDDIEILDAEDDEDTVKIKVDVNSVHELKDYLSGKGIDLEEKIGGEIVDDEEGEEKEDDAAAEDGEEKKDGDEEDPFGDMDFGDIFGDDEEGAE